MTVQSSESVTVLFTTRNPATSAATNTTSTPTGVLYQNGTANAATVTVTNISTGIYKAQVTMPILAAGDEVQLVAAWAGSSGCDWMTDTGCSWMVVGGLRVISNAIGVIAQLPVQV